MIVMDIESSGLNTGKCGIWQIGAMELENPENIFIEEARIDNEDIIEEEALKIIGKNESELRDETKQSQEQLIKNFLKWSNTCKTRLVIGHNTGWDFFFIRNKSEKYNLLDEFSNVLGHNVIDTFSIAQMRHLELKGNFSFNEDGRGRMSLKRVLNFAGLVDNRIQLHNKNDYNEKGTPHNALEDAKLTAEAFSRIIYGKKLLEEYTEFEIPEELKK